VSLPANGPRACLVLLLVTSSWAAAGQSPYAPLAERPLKALSDEQIDEYLEGRGMGLALAAELNGYPGPMHVLELADTLALSEAQRREVEAIFGAMRSEAIALGGEIVDRERRLDELFAERRIDETALAEATEALGRLNGRLRGVHLAAHLATARVLSEEQVERYAEARGYGAGGGHHGHPPGGHPADGHAPDGHPPDGHSHDGHPHDGGLHDGGPNGGPHRAPGHDPGGDGGGRQPDRERR
jgi:Spy/CpxP family protein refolding chaperone